MTYTELENIVIRGISELYGYNEARSLQRFLFSALHDMSRTEYLLKRTEEADTDFQHEVLKALPLLMQEMPVQYVLGKTWFLGREFKVKPGVLIPRPETEELVRRMIRKYKETRGLRILDIGTGSGVIAISLAQELNEAVVSGTDVSEKALEIARINADVNLSSVSFLRNNILDNSGWNSFPRYNVIVSNPPYVKRSEMKRMRRNVLDYEPESALFVDDNDPLIFYRMISNFAIGHLAQRGDIWFEINESEAEHLCILLEQKGFAGISVYRDFNGKDRVICAGLTTE